jgi:hypothetical protein
MAENALKLITEFRMIEKTTSGILKRARCMISDIPFPKKAPTRWKPILSAIKDAGKAFDYGGRVGWNDCVTNVQFALQKWRMLTPHSNVDLPTRDDALLALSMISALIASRKPEAP